MARLTVIYWRDIPAQVTTKNGETVRRPLHPRFQEAIDEAAMRSGAHESGDYAKAFERRDQGEVEGDAATVALDTATRLEQEYDDARLRALSVNGGQKE
ncbi:MAG: virulence factor [Alphaproteobacteria bacterium]|jgi:hypothetical protein|nr:virulence factor [Alphaproteobacteria bacterium]HJP22680.1 virulence factor [Alphaproteobacteria bacterium]